MQTIAIIDFETTGLSPAQGSRATEIAAVLVRDGEIVGSYQNLMKSNAWVPPFIEQLTGISNAMLKEAPAAEQVMMRSVPLLFPTSFLEPRNGLLFITPIAEWNSLPMSQSAAYCRRV